MKYDLKKDRKDLYAPGSHDFVRVTVPLTAIRRPIFSALRPKSAACFMLV